MRRLAILALAVTALILLGADQDGDTVADAIDNCSDRPNASQTDTDEDGYGNACDGDFNNDGAVDAVDANLFKSRFLETVTGCDLVFDMSGNDGLTGAADANAFRLQAARGEPGPGAGVGDTGEDCSGESCYYVEEGVGSDSNPGTEALPFATVAACAQVVNQGDTCFIKDGTLDGVYENTTANGHCPAQSGVAGNLITFKPFAGHTPILRSSTLNVPAFGCVGPVRHYIRLEGLELDGSVVINGPGGCSSTPNTTSFLRGWEIENNEIYDGSYHWGRNWSGIFSWQTWELLVKDNTIRDIDATGEDPFGPGGTGVKTGCTHDPVIEYNYIYDTTDNTRECVSLKWATSGARVRCNVCEQNTELGTPGGAVELHAPSYSNDGVNSEGNWFYENLVKCAFDNFGAKIGPSDSGGSGSSFSITDVDISSGVKFYNNTFVNCAGLHVGGPNGDVAQSSQNDLEFYNNLMSFAINGEVSIIHLIHHDSFEPTFLDYNLYYLTGTGARKWWENRFTDLDTEQEYTSFATWQGRTPDPIAYDQNSINGQDPLFTNRAYTVLGGGDYTLQGGSPAIDVGCADPDTCDPNDPPAGRPDIGAYPDQGAYCSTVGLLTP